MQLLQEVGISDGSPTGLLQGQLLLRLRVCVTAVHCRRSAEVRRRGSAAGAWRLAPGACGGGLAGERDWVGEKRRLTRERLREADARGGRSSG